MNLEERKYILLMALATTTLTIEQFTEDYGKISILPLGYFIKLKSNLLYNNVS